MRRMSAADVVKMTYGYDTLPHKDPIVDLVNEATTQFGDVTEAGKVWLVDLIPSSMPLFI